jgi:hypothetical protein
VEQVSDQSLLVSRFDSFYVDGRTLIMCKGASVFNQVDHSVIPVLRNVEIDSFEITESGTSLFTGSTGAFFMIEASQFQETTDVIVPSVPADAVGRAFLPARDLRG